MTSKLKTDVLETVSGSGTIALTNQLSGMTSASVPSGSVLQVIEGTPYTAYATTSVIIPRDDTIPQISEGTEYVTVAITPTSSSSKLHITASSGQTNSGAAAFVTMALFQDSTANALASSYAYHSAANWPRDSILKYEMTSGTTSETTFRLRMGASTSTASVNGNSSGRQMGGTTAVRLAVMEVKG
jgi:hypothetical protein